MAVETKKNAGAQAQPKIDPNTGLDMSRFRTSLPENGEMVDGEAAVRVLNYMVYRAPASAPNDIMNDPKGHFPPGEETFKGAKRVHCGNIPATGYLADVLEYDSKFQDPNKKKEFDPVTGEELADKVRFLSLCLTEPCPAIQNERLVVAEPGQCILIAMGSGLEPLFNHATHPTKSLKVSIQPGGTKTLANKNTPREWRVVQYGGLVDRSTIKIAALPALPAPTGEMIAQLPQSAGPSNPNGAGATAQA